MNCWRTITLACCVAALFLSSQSRADDVIIDQASDQNISLGDFACSSCPGKVGNRFDLAASATDQLTAGELWTFFASQGIDTLDSLTLCIDLQPNFQMANSIGIDKINFQIEDPNGLLLTNASLGQHKLLVPDYEISSSKPEAKLEFELGYDFMTRFSAESIEKVSLNFNSNSDESSSPMFAVAGASEFLPTKFSASSLIWFAIFWIAVFIALNRFTKPVQQLVEDTVAPTAKGSSASASSEPRALSA